MALHCATLGCIALHCTAIALHCVALLDVRLHRLTYMQNCMHACMHAHMHTCKQACMQTCMHTCGKMDSGHAERRACWHVVIHAQTYACRSKKKYIHAYLHEINTCIHAHIFACMHRCKKAGMLACRHADMRACTCMRACMHHCISYAYIPTCGMRECLREHMHTGTLAHLHTCTNKYMHACMHAFVYAYTHAYMWHACRMSTCMPAHSHKRGGLVIKGGKSTRHIC